MRRTYSIEHATNDTTLLKSVVMHCTNLVLLQLTAQGSEEFLGFRKEASRG